MRLSTVLRSGPSVWAATVLVPLLVWSGAGNTTSTIAYAPSVSAQSTIVLGYVSAVCGACAAWEASRLKEGGVWSLAPARGGLAMAGLHLGPVAVLGVVGLGASLAVYASAAFADPSPMGAVILATAFAVVLAHIALGWLLGRRMPRVLGAAVMLTFGYLWGFWPGAVGDMPWLRHLNGQGVTECCGLDREPSLRSMAATWALSAAVVLTVVLASRIRRRGVRWWACGGAMAAGVAAGMAFAVPLGFEGTQARDTALLTCTGQAPEVCLWPEQYAQRERISGWAADASRRNAAAGVEPAGRVEFGETAPDETTVRTIVSTASMPVDPPACALRPNASYPGDAAYGPLDAWLALTGGADPSILSERWPAQDVRLAEQVRQLPPSAQRAWYERNLRSLRDCSIAPDLAPASYAAGAGDGP
ncbi:DUF7224 domain-containing protein [Streptomyces sp. SP18CS02]|uniref:DUF7224 domain-containing protein n=1 Tax=Streptomyces sp. SP18CS02 TaxID=3002531 RepID=UPI002E770087|nr:hypothetical protein [Streptomyces sp. SP18CS02]MEE1753009.1 hypothetical protein [Streptomyces sp. SP18CS02]